MEGTKEIAHLKDVFYCPKLNCYHWNSEGKSLCEMRKRAYVGISTSLSTSGYGKRYGYEECVNCDGKGNDLPIDEIQRAVELALRHQGLKAIIRF